MGSIMTILSVGELKPRFSDVLKDVRDGREVVISYGRKKEKVAVIIPYRKSRRRAVKPKSPSVENHDLDPFIGTWVDDPEFDKALKAFETIDTDIWK